MNDQMKIKRRIFEVPVKSPDFTLIALISLFIFCCIVLSSLFQADTWIESHELERYQELVDAFREAFLAGKYYPRWLPDLYGGYGYPTFVFYQPGYFFWCLPYSLIFQNTALAMKLSVFILVFFRDLELIYLPKRLWTRKQQYFLGFALF